MPMPMSMYMYTYMYMYDFQVRILHSAEEDYVSPLDSNIACLCQGIEINNNKYVYVYVYVYVSDIKTLPRRYWMFRQSGITYGNKH